MTLEQSVWITGRIPFKCSVLDNREPEDADLRSRRYALER